MDIWLSKYLFVDGGIPAPVGRFFLFSGLIAHYAHFRCSEMFYRWKLCRIEAINSTTYLSTGKMMQPLYWAHCFSRASAISNIRSLSLWKPKCRRSGFAAQRPRGMWSSIGIPQLLHTHQRICCKLPSHKFFCLLAATFSITNRSKNKKKRLERFPETELDAS